MNEDGVNLDEKNTKITGLDEIINKLDRFAKIKPYHEVFADEIIKALNTKGLYIKDISIDEFHYQQELLTLLLMTRKNMDNITTDFGSMFMIIHDEKINRTVVLLPNTIIGIDGNLENIYNFIQTLDLEIEDSIKEKYGRIINYEKNIAFGEMFLTSINNHYEYGILNIASINKWEKVNLNNLIISVKGNDENKFIYIPQEEISQYFTNELIKKYGNNKTRKIFLTRSLEEKSKPYKEIINLVNRYKMFYNDDIISLPSQINNPQEISSFFMRLVTTELGGNLKFLDLMKIHEYKRIRLYDNTGDFFLTILPNEVILSRFEPSFSISDELVKLDDTMKKILGCYGYFKTWHTGRIYYCPSRKKSDNQKKIHFTFTVCDKQKEMRVEDLGSLIIIDNKSIIDFIENIIKCEKNKLKKS